MKTLNVRTNKSYNVIIDSGFTGLRPALECLFPAGGKACVITDKNVGKLYGKALVDEIAGFFGSISVLELEAGENSKKIDVLSLVYQFLLDDGADRSSVIIALGGGVVGDLAGFAAATYMRGTPLLQIPTTLLAQVDSSVGGKTAIDFGGFKNLIGAFYQPDLVYINTETLATLPSREFSNGMAEVLKYGLISDEDFFRFLTYSIERLKDVRVLSHIICNCVGLKARIVESDERDVGGREILNFGHTVGHAVETLKNFELLHGECVAIGTVAALHISCERGYITNALVDEYKMLLGALNLPAALSGATAEQIYETMRKDKKSREGNISFVLLRRLGCAQSFKGLGREEMINAIKMVTKEG